MLDLVPMMLNKSVSLFLVLWLSLTHCIGHHLTPRGHSAQPLIGQQEANADLWLAKSVPLSLVNSLRQRALVFSVLNYLLKLRVLKENILFYWLVDDNNKARAWEPQWLRVLMLAAVAGCMMKVNINFYDILFLYRRNYTLNNSYMKDKFYVMLQLLQATALANMNLLFST